MRLLFPCRSRVRVGPLWVSGRDEYQIHLLPIAGGLEPAKPDPPSTIHIAIPRVRLDPPAVNFPCERAGGLIARIVIAVPFNRFVQKLAEAACITVSTQLTQAHKVLPAVAGIQSKCRRRVWLLGIIALRISCGGRGSVADDKFVDRQIELFTAGTELMSL